MQELSEENAKLADENRQIHVSIKKVLQDNAELTNRLIEIALRTEEGGDAIFGSDGRGAGSPRAGVSASIMTTSQEDMRKRRIELTEQVDISVHVWCKLHEALSAEAVAGFESRQGRRCLPQGMLQLKMALLNVGCWGISRMQMKQIGWGL